MTVKTPLLFARRRSPGISSLWGKAKPEVSFGSTPCQEDKAVLRRYPALAVFHAAAAAAMAGCCRARGFSAEQHNTANIGSPTKRINFGRRQADSQQVHAFKWGDLFSKESPFFFFFFFSPLFLTSEVALKGFGEG